MKFAAAWLALALPALTLPALAQTLFFSKDFPGSAPAWVSVEVSKDGGAVYKESPDDENPVEFKLGPGTIEEMFKLVDKLGRFKTPLESGLKVAKMGEKTFRLIDGTDKNQVTFNYSLDENARLLLDVFERITETQQLLFVLERTARFDKLGVNKALLQVESAWDRKRIVGPERFLPMLDRVAKNGSYLNMARERADALANAFRNPAPSAAGTEGK